ncbi:MAG: hypothetical protein WCK96_17375, partial [Methylococcales bacterium]
MTASHAQGYLFRLFWIVTQRDGLFNPSRTFVFWHDVQHNITIKTLQRSNIPRRASDIVVILVWMPESSHTDVINSYHPWHWISASLPK